MKLVTSLCVALSLVLGLAGTIGSEVVFTTEPQTPLRPRPGLRLSPSLTVEWGSKYDRIKTVGRWSRVTFTDTSDVFIWSEWLATYEVVEEKPLAKDAFAVYFTVRKYLGGPVLEAMCRDLVDNMRKQKPALRELSVTGYLAGEYPDGQPVCTARWTSGSPLEISAPEAPVVGPRDEEIYTWLGELYRSVERKGVPIFACDSLWIEAGQELGMSPAAVRFVYDRVRWSKAKYPEPDEEESSGSE
jgi:hypothetical protein